MSVRGLKRGDLVQLVGYDSKFQVVWTYASSREQESYHCKFNIVITHWDCLKTAYIPTICDYQDKSPRIIGKIRFIEQFRTSNCTINEIYLGKSEDSNIKEL